MPDEPAPVLASVESATARVLAAAAALGDADVRAPSLLPGWTRGHVLTHLARNADGLTNLLTWARTGVETPMYAGRAQRDADIEAGAGRPAAAQIADLAAASDRFAGAARALPAGRADVIVRTGFGRLLRGGDVPWGRLREVEIHHVDLGVDYTPARWDRAFVARLLPEVAASFEERDGVPAVSLRAVDTGRAWELGAGERVEVAGEERALLAWLIGRSSGDGLRLSTGSLPVIPPWA